MSRRIRRLSLALAALVAVGVVVLVAYDPADPPQPASAAQDCRLAPGDSAIGDGALLHVPTTGRVPVPLVLAFHGAGGNASGMASSRVRIGRGIGERGLRVRPGQ